MIWKLNASLGKLITTFSCYPEYWCYNHLRMQCLWQRFLSCDFSPYSHNLLILLDHPGQQELDLIHFCIPDAWHGRCSIDV